MQGIRLASAILLVGFTASADPGSPPAPPAPLSFQLKAGANCEPLPKGCEQPIKELKPLANCRANKKAECALDLTITKTITKADGEKVNNKKSVIVKVDDLPSATSTLKSIKIENTKIAKESILVISIPTVTDLSTPVFTNWKEVKGCTVTEKKSIDCPTVTGIDALKTPFYVAVVAKDKKKAIESDDKLNATIVLNDNKFSAIPKLTANNAKFKLEWAAACAVTDNACKDNIANLDALKTCLDTHEKEDCKVTPTVTLTSDQPIKPIDTGIKDAKFPLPVIAIDTSELNDTIFDLAALELKNIDFGLTPALKKAPSVIMNKDLKDLTTGKVTGTVSVKGAVTTPHTDIKDFASIVFAYLVPADEDKNKDLTCKPKIVLAGTETLHEKSNEKEVEQNAEWKADKIAVTPTGQECHAESCKTIKTPESLGTCVNDLKKIGTCTNLSLDATITGGKSTNIKIQTKEYAAFEIKTIQGADIHFGLSVTAGTGSAQQSSKPVPVIIDQIEFTVPDAKTSTYELFELSFDTHSKQYTPKGNAGKPVTLQEAVGTIKSLNIEVKDNINMMTFGVLQKSKRSVRRLGDTPPAKTPLALKDIKISLKVNNAAIKTLVYKPIESPSSLITTTKKGLNGLINGGLLLTGATLMVSLMM